MSSLDLFRTYVGVDVVASDLSSNAFVLQGSHLPGSDAVNFPEEIDAPIGSTFMYTVADSNKNQFWTKFSVSAGTNADWVQVTSKTYIDALVQGLSWREPVAVAVTAVYASLVAAVAAINAAAGVVDGYTLLVGDRLIFVSPFTGTPTVGNQVGVVVSTAPVVVKYVDDPTLNPGPYYENNTLTKGDAVLVTNGTLNTDTQWVYNDISFAWVQMSSATGNIEIGYINSFIGKPSLGPVMPTYGTNNAVITGTSLEAAISALDLTLGDGDITNTTGNYALTADMAWFSGGTLTITSALNDLNNRLGTNSFTGPYLTNTTVTANLQSLSNSLVFNNFQQTLTNQTANTYVTVDTITPNGTDGIQEVKWMVMVRDNAAPNKVRAVEVHAVVDWNTAAAPSTGLDYTKYADIKVSGGPTGFSVQVVITAGPLMEVQAKATNAFDVSVRRVATNYFAL
jgi:hypothetical protein